MKKLFLCAAILSLCAAAAAQEKGDMLIGGSIELSAGSSEMVVRSGGSSLTEKGTYPTSFGLGAEFGYFALNNFRVGVQLKYDLSMSPLTHGSKLKTQSHKLFVAPSLAYYVKLADKFYYTPGLLFGIGCEVDKEDIDISSTKNLTSFVWGVSLNLASFEFQAKPRLGIGLDCASLGFQSVISHPTGNSSESLSVGEFGLNLGRVSVHLRYYF